MTLPKALLCMLGVNNNNPEAPMEMALRNVGFATATLYWSEFNPTTGDWLQLADILSDKTIVLWVLSGNLKSFTSEILRQVSYITLALEEEELPLTAFVLSSDNQKEELLLPPFLEHIKLCHNDKTFAARLMAARLKPFKKAERPFYMKAHASPLTGIWLELGPLINEIWEGFMIGATKAHIEAFGVGSRGIIPKNSSLNYPIYGLEGYLGTDKFKACAAKNVLDHESSVYVSLNDVPERLIIGSYPEDQDPIQEQNDTWARVLALS